MVVGTNTGKRFCPGTDTITFFTILLKDNLFKMSYSSYDPERAQQRRMQQEVQQMQQQAMATSMIQALASQCWDKCITRADSTISSRETECVANCAGRFIDTQKFMMGRLQKQSQKHA